MPRITDPGTSLVIQWLTLHLPVQGSRSDPWSGKMPRATGQRCHNCWGHSNQWSLRAQSLCPQQGSPATEAPAPQRARAHPQQWRLSAARQKRTTGRSVMFSLNVVSSIYLLSIEYTYLPIIYHLSVNHLPLSNDDRIDSILFHKFLRHIYKTFWSSLGKSSWENGDQVMRNPNCLSNGFHVVIT